MNNDGQVRGAVWRRWLICCLLVLAPLPSSVLAEPELEPVEVSVRLHLLDLNAVDTETETFSVNGDLYLTWPAEARPSEWQPTFHVVNAQSLHLFYQTRGRQKVDGRQVEVLKVAFQARLNSQFRFEQFPFDSNRLKLYLEPADELGEERFFTDPGAFTVDPLAFDSQWRIEDFRAEEVSLGGGDPNAANRLSFSFHISRLSGYHVWYYFLPLILITATPWTVFWYKPPNPQVPVVSMLGLVAYNMVFARHLPQLGYLTLADAFFLHCLAGIFATTVGCAAVLNSADCPEREQRLLRLFRWLLPLLQVSSGIVLLVWWR